MELTLLKDLVTSSSIYYDPSDINTTMEMIMFLWIFIWYFKK